MTLKKLTLATLLFTSSITFAHEVWLKPSATVVSDNNWITVDAAVSNDMFYFNHFPLGLDNLKIIDSEGQFEEIQNQFKGAIRSVFDFKTTKTGTYQVAIVNSGAGGNYVDNNGDRKRLRGTVDEIAKQVPKGAKEVNIYESETRIETFVTRGKPTKIKNIGKGLELAPTTHPNDLVVGEEAILGFTADGKPIANVEVTIIFDGKRYRDNVDEMTFKTDKNGQFKVKFPQGGLYWLDADLNDKKMKSKLANERRLSYVATLEVLP